MQSKNGIYPDDEYRFVDKSFKSFAKNNNIGEKYDKISTLRHDGRFLFFEFSNELL